MRPVIGLGAAQAIAAGGTGRVIATFSSACYVELPGGVIALVGPRVHRGPVHVCPPGPVTLPPVGLPAAARGGVLRVAGVVVDSGRATVWSGPLPEGDLGAGLDILMAATEGIAAGSCLPEFGARWAAGAERLAEGDLVGAALQLGGLGPGLTPSGDDFLAGALLLIRALRGPSAEDHLDRAVAVVETNRISGAFLHWAARGQGLEPVHDLLGASARGDLDSARRAAAALGRVGATSGADLCLGLWQAARSAASADLSGLTLSP